MPETFTASPLRRLIDQHGRHVELHGVLQPVTRHNSAATQRKEAGALGCFTLRDGREGGRPVVVLGIESDTGPEGIVVRMTGTDAITLAGHLTRAASRIAEVEAALLAEGYTL